MEFKVKLRKISIFYKVKYKITSKVNYKMKLAKVECGLDQSTTVMV